MHCGQIFEYLVEIGNIWLKIFETRPYSGRHSLTVLQGMHLRTILPGGILCVEHGEERLEGELDLALVGGAARLEEDVLGADLGEVESERGQELVAAGDVPQAHVHRHQRRR